MNEYIKICIGLFVVYGFGEMLFTRKHKTSSAKDLTFYAVTIPKADQYLGTNGPWNFAYKRNNSRVFARSFAFLFEVIIKHHNQ